VTSAFFRLLLAAPGRLTPRRLITIEMTKTDPQRPCPECEAKMTLRHDGRFSTLYVCRNCGSMLTIPPAVPATSPKTPGGSAAE
jgi:predicted RNA-binding Zn-ribbon protein involved in translation (DUF1610 family)